MFLNVRIIDASDYLWFTLATFYLSCDFGQPETRRRDFDDNMFCGNRTLDVCDGDDQAPIYIQVLGTIVFAVVWPFVVFDMKWFPLGRPAAALLGAVFMVVTHVVTQDDVYEIQSRRGNLQTIFLLVGMMMLSYYYDREGILQTIGLWVLGKENKPFRSILWKVCLMSAVLSALFTNDATCLVVTPLLLQEFQKHKQRDKKELLSLCLGIATSANIGSAATVFGNPQNAFIASAAGVNLLEFLMSLFPAAIIGVLVNILVLYVFHWCHISLCFKRCRDSITQPNITAEDTNIKNDSQVDTKHLEEQTHSDRTAISVPSQKRTFIQSYSESDINVNKESSIATERNELYNSATANNSLNTNVKKKRSRRQIVFFIWLGFITLLVIILLAIPPPPVVHAKFNLGLVPLGAAILTMLVDTILNRTYAHDVLLKIDWTVILMFMGLFVWLEGFQKTCYVSIAFDYLAPYMNLHTIEGVLLFTVFVIVGSNLFSNVPLTILIVNRISDLCGDEDCEGPLAGLLLAWISTVAGNFTLIGSVANLIVAEKARSSAKYKLKFWNYLKFGCISTFIVLFGCLPIVYFIGKVA